MCITEYLDKVDEPKSNMATIWTPIFEWCVVRCESKKRHKKTCVQKGLECVLKIVLGPIVSLIGGPI